MNLMAVLRFEHPCPVFTLLYRQYFYGIAAISDQAARFMFFAACSQTNYYCAKVAFAKLNVHPEIHIRQTDKIL